jgi:hypothetical protein
MRAVVADWIGCGTSPASVYSSVRTQTRSMLDRYNIVDENDLREAQEAVGRRYVQAAPATG